MFKHVSKKDFLQTFKDFARQDNFSQEGLLSLFNYFEETEAEGGIPIEFDCIAVCCEWNEAYYKYIARDFDVPQDVEDRDNYEQVLNYLESKTTVLPLSGKCLVYRVF